MGYTELQVTTNFSFLRGASHPEEIVDQAAELGYTTIGISDHQSMAGIVRAHVAAKKKGLRILPGCQVSLQDGLNLILYPESKTGYAQICELLTVGNLRTEKGQCLLYRKDCFDKLSAVRLILVPPPMLEEQMKLNQNFIDGLHEFKYFCGKRLYLAARRQYNGQDAKYIFRLSETARVAGIPMLATNDVYYHHPSRRPLQDVLTCIREKTSIHKAGFRLHYNAERYLKPAIEMERLFRQYPESVALTNEISDACGFSLDELRYEYPEEIVPSGVSPLEELTRLAWAGATEFFGDPVPEKTVKAIIYELDFIERMDYAPYFLTVYDIVRFARSRGILCQGRGSAANSTVCFCLGITSVNPEKFDLLFERFISDARNEPPDIDVDFEHERREEVIQYIYEKYGRDRAAIVATVTEQHQKGAIRDVSKAMGLSSDTIQKLAGSMLRSGDGWFDEKRLSELGLQATDPYLTQVLELTAQYMGFPRQLGQHTGGFVISRRKLSELCPVLNARMADRTCIEWNKDDIEAMGFLKIDVLALGMLTCIRKCFTLLREHYGRSYSLATIPQDDPEVYEMISHADTIGVFQIESRAQQSMLPRLKPKCFYDLVIEVAIVRPGPIQGDMVHPYLRRRNGQEAVEYPSEELREILGKTLGVPLFQEQAMKIAIVAAGFTPAEADELRRSMATFKAKGKVSALEKKLISGMTRKGYSLDYANRVFRQLEGFGSYGFPESHAASFALLVYVSCWIKCHYPDVFTCALLNSQPMGFYQPAQIVADARKHGVTVLPADVNHSEWDHQLVSHEGKYHALRLGFRQIKGMRSEDAVVLVAARKSEFTTIQSLRDSGLSDAALEILADADAFRSLGLDRRMALWEISRKDHHQDLFRGQLLADSQELQVSLPFMPESEHVMQDYASTSLSLKAHPLEFIREKLSLLHANTISALPGYRNGDSVKIAGMVLIRQRPQTAKGIWFVTIEDETGVANLVIFPNIYESCRKEFIQSRVLMVEGKLQIEGEVIHVIVQRCFNMTTILFDTTRVASRNLTMPALSRADEVIHGHPEANTVQSLKSIIPGSRDCR